MKNLNCWCLVLSLGVTTTFDDTIVGVFNPEGLAGVEMVPRVDENSYTFTGH
jgi:hypothetical protein